MNLSLILFLIGIFGFVLNKKNIILMLVSIEIMLLAITFLTLVTSLNFDDISGQVYAIYIIAIAGVESAIGLGILVAFYRLRGSLAIEFILDTAQFCTDFLQHLLKIAYSSIKWCLNSPPKPHAFARLPLQSNPTVPFDQCNQAMDTLLSQFNSISLTLVTVMLGMFTNKIIAICSNPTSSIVIFDQVVPLVAPLLNGMLTYEQMQCIIAHFMLQDGAGVVMDSTHSMSMQQLARLSFSNLLFNIPDGIKLATLKLADPSTGEYLIESKWLVMALEQIGSDEANRILNILTSFRKTL